MYCVSLTRVKLLETVSNVNSTSNPEELGEGAQMNITSPDINFDDISRPENERNVFIF